MLKNYALDDDHEGEKRNSFILMRTFNQRLDWFGSGFIHIQL